MWNGHSFTVKPDPTAPSNPADVGKWMARQQQARIEKLEQKRQ